MDVIADQRGWECVERDPFGRIVGLTTRIRRQETHSVPAYTVLAPVDGSRASLAALRVAADIAGRLAESSLDVLNVQTILGCTGDDDDLLNAGLADTEIARQFLAGADASYRLRLAAGNPDEVILTYIREQKIAEVVMGADGTGSVGCALLGSVALDVLGQVEIPVTLVKSRIHSPRFAQGTGDLLIAYDGSAGSLRALHYGLRYANGLNNAPRIHLLNLQAANDGLSAGKNSGTRLSQRTTALEACDAALRALETVRADFEFHVAHGDPVEKILQLAASVDCCRIVMSSRGLGWFAALMARSISWAVLYRTSIPITLVK
ncbi:universal stress protein [Aromatoleum toluclasticum]|uniref:universal stress protein n=1 Tax=Aromatoleum toluclasticum TaxID=92003 RepID=UPI0009FEAE90|nr:universal stress protein [Aromatoleum toluclasticum]